MKFKLPLISAMLAIASLAACGGSGSDSGSSAPAVSVPATLTYTDTAVGTGATAVAGKTVKVHYTGYLYSTGVASFKGTQIDSSAGLAPYQFVLGSNAVIAGFDIGVTGMKVGGKRTVMFPASQGYGAAGNSKVPPNTGLVFDLELVEVL